MMEIYIRIALGTCLTCQLALSETRTPMTLGSEQIPGLMLYSDHETGNGVKQMGNKGAIHIEGLEELQT